MDSYEGIHKYMRIIVFMDDEFKGCMLDCLIGGENLNLEGGSSLQGKDKGKKA